MLLAGWYETEPGWSRMRQPIGGNLPICDGCGRGVLGLVERRVLRIQWADGRRIEDFYGFCSADCVERWLNAMSQFHTLFRCSLCGVYYATEEMPERWFVAFPTGGGICAACMGTPDRPIPPAVADALQAAGSPATLRWLGV